MGTLPDFDFFAPLPPPKDEGHPELCARFCELGRGRSLAALSSRVAYPPALLRQWHDAEEWAITAAAWDAEAEAERMATGSAILGRGLAAGDHAFILQGGRDLIAREVGKYLLLSEGSPEPVMGISPLTRLLREVVTMERLTHGAATEIGGYSAEAMEALPDSVLEALAALPRG